jgi:hypothetical protein
MYGYFMQDKVTAHRTNFSMSALFGIQLITCGLWPPNLQICISVIILAGH